MKKICIALFVVLPMMAVRADLLFSDSLNYPDGCIETDGLWYCTSPAVPYDDAFVSNHLLILNSANNDSVAAPTNGIVNPGAPNVVYASFTINVSKLPSVNGGYFCDFMDVSNNTAAHIFVDTRGTVVPGTYRLGIANNATSITTAGATNFPVDLATGITYQVVFSWDETSDELGGWLWINPSSSSDQYVFALDTINNDLTSVSSVEFSQYGGVQAIGNVMIGTSFSDVMTNVAQLPVIGIQPRGTTNYSGANYTLYTAASGMDVTYQWLSNNVPMTDDGTTVVGAQSNILNLTNLQNTANYSVVAMTTAGSVTSDVAQVTVDTTPTPPFFTTQPQSQTNSVGGTLTLTGAANGTGPITYQWFFEPTGGASFSPLSSQTSPTLTLSGIDVDNAGSYYLQATGDGSQNSDIATVTVIPPPTVTIGYLHTFLTTNATPTTTNLNNGTIYNVRGVVTSFGQVLSSKYSEYFIQDDTGGAVVFLNGFGVTNVPPVGSLVSITCIAEEYYGQLEVDPLITNSVAEVAILASNTSASAFSMLDIPSISVPLDSYGIGLEGSIVTMTNVYLYSSSSGAAVSGTFPVNSSKTLYAFQQPYYAGEPYVRIYVTTYTNELNQLNTNYFNQLIPSFCYQLSGGIDYYNTTEPEVDPSRYADFVTTAPAAFLASVALTNGIPTLTWPAVVGSTYSVYSATNLLGPWTQTFGLSYYPGVGAYTDTNSAAAGAFYRVSTP